MPNNQINHNDSRGSHKVKKPSVTPSLPILCRRCRVCNNFYAQFLDYIDFPKIITFELRDKTTVLDTIVSVRQLSDADLDYRLAGILYFGNIHFIAHIIKQDGQI